MTCRRLRLDVARRAHPWPGTWCTYRRSQYERYSLAVTSDGKVGPSGVVLRPPHGAKCDNVLLTQGKNARARTALSESGMCVCMRRPASQFRTHSFTQPAPQPRRHVTTPGGNPHPRNHTHAHTPHTSTSLGGSFSPVLAQSPTSPTLLPASTDRAPERRPQHLSPAAARRRPCACLLWLTKVPSLLSWPWSSCSRPPR